MKVHYSFILICLFILPIHSQDVAQDVTDQMTQYFKNNQGSLHAHLNKSKYFAGEEIWFSLYHFNRTSGVASQENINAIVSLFDNQDNEIHNALYLLKSGKSNGSILLSQTLPSGTYYLKVFTPTMNELQQDESFVSTIEIINPDSPETSNTQMGAMAYDIQVLPEGGHLVQNIENICGLKILNSRGKGVSIENISLVDQDNNTIVSGIKTNKLGMGKFNFTPVSGYKYQLKTILDGTEKQIDLPQINTRGIVMRTQQNYTSGDIQVILQTNVATLSNIERELITLMIHKNGASKSYEVEFADSYPTIEFKIPNRALFLGVNTLTLFNQKGEPIVERVIYNTKTTSTTEGIAKQLSTKGDTTTYDLKVLANGLPIEASLSVSVLPKGSVSQAQKDGIYASVYINPFIQGSLEQPHYYFDNPSFAKMYELDLLMLNQGWSKYAWSDIFNFTETMDYYKESPGISLEGSVRLKNTNDTPSKILLYANKNKVFETQTLNTDLTFAFDQLELDGGSKLSLSLLDHENKPVPSDIFYSYGPGNKDRTHRFQLPKKTSTTTNIRSALFADQLDNRTELEEAVVVAKKKKYAQYFKGWHSPTIDAGERNRGNLRAFIDTYGYWRSIDGGVHREIYDMTGMNLISVRPKIIVDGIPQDDKFIADALNMKDVEEVYVDRKGKIHVFIVFTNQKWARNTPTRTAKEINVTDWGYTPPKTFYTPLYTDLNSSEYDNFGVISWHPNVETNQEGNATISLLNPAKKDLIVHAEGMDATGKPISFVTEIIQR